MNSNSTDPIPIVLAAGKGERFEGLKQLTEVDGEPVLQLILQSISKIDWALSPLLVLGHERERIENAVDTCGFKVIENENWQQGLSTSLKSGINAAPRNASGYLFFLGDMPLISSDIIKVVLNRADSGSSIVAPSYQGKRGFPVYLSRQLEENLLTEISGDKGAREIIRKKPDQLTLINTEDRGVIMDLDEKSDLSEIRSYLLEEGTEIGV